MHDCMKCPISLYCVNRGFKWAMRDLQVNYYMVKCRWCGRIWLYSRDQPTTRRLRGKRGRGKRAWPICIEPTCMKLYNHWEREAMSPNSVTTSRCNRCVRTGE